MTVFGRFMRFDLTLSGDRGKGERIATTSLRTGLTMTVVGKPTRSRYAEDNLEIATALRASQ